jgi:hypothetical protein
MKNLQKIVEVIYDNVGKFSSSKCLFFNKPKRWKFWLGAINI